MDPTRRRTLLLGLAVFAVALLIRVVGIGWGLPNEKRNHSLHPDEPVIFLYSQRIEPAKLDFTPGFYNYGTLYLTVLRVASDMADTYGAGPKDSTEDAMWQAVGRYHLVGRGLSAVAGAATALFVLLILLPHVGTFGSLLGAAAMALAPGHVVHSRFQTVDVLATCFLVASLYFALRLAGPEREKISDSACVKFAVLSGVFAGLSAGTKYTGIIALVTLIVVALSTRRSVSLRAIGLALFSAISVFLIVTPGVVTDSAQFLRDFKYELTHTQTGHGLVFAGTPSGFIVHIQNTFVALGGLVTLIGAFGLLRASYRKHAWALGLVAFAVVYYVLIGRAEVKFMRYVFPLVPVLAVGFGWMMSRAALAVRAEGNRLLLVAGGVVGLFGALGIASTASLTVTYTSWMAAPDLRDSLADEIRAASNEETTVGLTGDPWFYSPSLYKNIAAGPWIEPRPGEFEKRKEWMDAAMSPRVVRFVPPAPEERIDWDRRLLTQLRPDYVVFSGFEIGDLNRLRKLPSPPSEFKLQLGRAEEFMDTLLTEYDLWKVRGTESANLPHDMTYVRPELQVWKRKTSSAIRSSGTSTISEQSGAPAPTP
jgi:hypothetical protein